MSKGGFVTLKYQMSKADFICGVRCQPETETLTVDGTANSDATGAISFPYLVRVGGGKREIGCRTRLVGFKFTEGNTPAGYKPGTIIYLPWFDPATFGTIVSGQTGTYAPEGSPVPIVVAGAIPEAGR
jgi:hypothetical protein